MTVTLFDGHISADLLVGESALNKGQCVELQHGSENVGSAPSFRKSELLKESPGVVIVERCHVTLTTSF